MSATVHGTLRYFLGGIGSICELVPSIGWTTASRSIRLTHCACQQALHPDNTEQATYNWARQWYPLAFLADLDPKVPHPVQLLGQRLVLWRDGGGEWRCFEDKCPHRLAPLSGPSLAVHAPACRVLHAANVLSRRVMVCTYN